MNKIKESIKNPTVIIDKSLDKYNDVVLFPEKLAKANEMIKKVGLPKIKERNTKVSDIA